LPWPSTAETQEVLPRRAAALVARDTLYLVGDARVDSLDAAAWEVAPSIAGATWRRALAFVEWNPGAVMTAGPAAAYEALDLNDAVLSDSVRSAIRIGAWAPIGGWWTHRDPGLLSGEAIIRQALYGQRFLYESFGQMARVGRFPISRSLSATIPQLLYGAGIRSVLVGGKLVGSEGDLEPSSLPGFAFDWIGNDGSRLFVLRPIRYGNYADFEFEFPGPPAMPTGPGRNGVATYGVKDPDWEGDGGGELPSSNPQLDDPPLLRFAGPAEALESVRASFGESLPSHRGGIYSGYDTVVPGERTGAQGAIHTDRDFEDLLRSAESLAAIAAGLPGGPPYPGEILAEAWRAHLETGTARADAERATKTIVRERFAAIRSEMETDREDVGAWVLLNPLGHPVRGAAFAEIVAGEDPGVAPATTARSHPVILDVDEIPSLGAITLPMGQDGLPAAASVGLPPPAAGDLWMENAYLRIEIDPATGAILRILDKTNRRQALRPDGRANVLWVTRNGAMRLSSDAEPTASGIPYRSATDEPGEMRRLLSLSSTVTARAARISLVRGWGNSTVRQELVLARAARFLEIRTELDWHDAGYQLHVSFDPVESPDSATFEAPYGTVSSEAVGIPAGANQLEADPDVLASHWAAAGEGGPGLSVISDRPAGWRYEKGRLRLWPVASTIPGTRLRYAIYPHDGSWQEAETHLLSSAYRTPILAAREPSHGGRLKNRFSFFSVETEAIEATWLKRAEEGEAFVVRLIERSGQAVEAIAHTACPRVDAHRADHLERPLEALSSRSGSFRIRMRANEIATVRFHCGS
jgi:alpha-mannosidase